MAPIRARAPVNPAIALCFCKVCNITKITKSASQTPQVGFIKFVVLPLFETLQYKDANGMSPLRLSGIEQPITMLKVCPSVLS